MIVRLGGLIVRKGCGEFRPVRAGEAIWPVCERAPVGDGEINLTFMRLPCWRGAEVPARRVTHFRNFKEQESSKKPVAR